MRIPFSFQILTGAFLVTAAMAGFTQSLPDGAKHPQARPGRPTSPTLHWERQARIDRGEFSTTVETLQIFKQAREANPARFAFAAEKGARFYATPDRQSFLLVWYPPAAPAAPAADSTPWAHGPDGGPSVMGNRQIDRPLVADSRAKPPMIVTLHGHGSYATDEFFLWYPEAARRGMGIIALQWWLGGGETMDDYYLPYEIYRLIDQFFRHERLPPRQSLLHGFSRGSANIFGVTAFDRQQGNGYFLVTLANAGKAGDNFPVNVDISSGRFGPEPFKGTNWIMYAGAHDPNPDRDGIPGMRESEAWVKSLRGTILDFIADPDGDHGGFHRNPANIRRALDDFQKLLQQP